MKASARPLRLSVHIMLVAIAIAILAVYAWAINSVWAEGDPTALMTAPVRALYNEGVAASQTGDLQTAREKFHAALEQARILEDKRGIIASFIVLGVVYMELQQYPQALENLSAALPYFADMKDQAGRGAEGLTLMLAGWAHAQMGNKASATEAFDRGLALTEKALVTLSEPERRTVLVQRANLLLKSAEAYEKFGQLQEAVDSYRRAGADFQAVEHRKMAGKALWDAAKIVHMKINAPQQAVNLYVEALTLLQEAGKVADATEVRMALGWAHIQAGNTQEAVAVYTEIIKHAEREGLSALAWRGHLGLGTALEQMGEIEQAFIHYQTILQRLREGTWKVDSDLEAKILLYKGEIHRRLAQYEEAVEHFQTAVVKYRGIQDAQGEAEALSRLAEVFYWLVDYKAAIQYYKQALELYKAAGNVLKQVEILAALGEISWVHKAANDAAEYFEYFQVGERLLDSLWGSELLVQLKEGLREGKISPEEAKQLWQQEWSKTLPPLDQEYWMAAGILYQKQGRVLLAMGTRLEGALNAAFMSLQFALLYHASLPARWDALIEIAKDLYFLAEAFRQQGALDSALQYYLDAAAITARLHSPEVHWIYTGLGRTYASLGDRDNALRHYRKALELLESIHRQQGTEEIKLRVLEGVFYTYRGFVTLLMDVYKKSGEEQYLLEAFQVNETLRARSFLDMLGKSRVTRLGGDIGWLAEKEEELRRNIARIHHQLRAPKLETAEETRLLDQLASLREHGRTLQRQAAQQSPRYAELVLPHTVTVEEVQSVLDTDTVLLEYTVGAERSTLWAITKEHLHAYSLPGQEGGAIVEQYLKTLREPLMGSEEVSQHVALGQRLYRELVAPAEQHLREKKHLIIAPDGPLYYLPFETLIAPESSGNGKDSTNLVDAPYLVKQFRVTYVPSASVLVAQRRAHSTSTATAPLPLVAFGDPVYHETGSTEDLNSQSGQIAYRGVQGRRWDQLRDSGTLSRLAFSGEEVHRIARIWDIPLDSEHINLRQQATVKRVRELPLFQYRMLHFATHGVLEDDAGVATQPALVLSLDSGDEKTGGLLQFTDILTLKLNADLVVLSACQTGLGRLRKGEGIIGLTRAFLYAGASSVVVSLWKVQDQSTSLLMEHFYRQLKQGQSKGEALRQAKLAVLQATIDLKAIDMQQPLASPFYWAPFILIGD